MLHFLFCFLLSALSAVCEGSKLKGKERGGKWGGGGGRKLKGHYAPLRSKPCFYCEDCTIDHHNPLVFCKPTDIAAERRKAWSHAVKDRYLSAHSDRNDPADSTGLGGKDTKKNIFICFGVCIVQGYISPSGSYSLGWHHDETACLEAVQPKTGSDLKEIILG